MHQIDIGANPDASDVSARRLVECVNDVKEAGFGADKLRRYTLAKDLANVEEGQTHDLFANLNKEQKEKMQQLLGRPTISELRKAMQ